MEADQFKDIIDRYISGRLKPEETVRLLDLLGERATVQQLELIMDTQLGACLEGEHNYPEVAARIKLAVANAIKNEHMTPAASLVPVSPMHRVNTRWLRYAAAVVLLLGTATYLYVTDRPHKEIIATQSGIRPVDVNPGGNKATLMLADGSVIVLDRAANGRLAKEGNTNILKLNDGALAYDANGPDTHTLAGNVLYNTIVTPRGGQYQITLPDGSRAWLNAASSLSFPVAFTQDHRGVKVTGEVYLEIAEDKSHPFIVTVNDMLVEVLGTAFNINAYADEKIIRTTVVEGRVRVKALAGNAAKQGTVLKSGQQSQLDGKNIINVKEADVEGAVAWKNGLFRMEGSDVPAIMRQLARWYDIEVEFKGDIPSGYISGKLPRSMSLANVLKVIENSGIRIKFKIDGKKLVVTAG